MFVLCHQSCNNDVLLQFNIHWKFDFKLTVLENNLAPKLFFVVDDD